MNRQPRQPRQLARRTRRQRAQGIETEEQVWKLSLNGLKQVEIAAQLGISPTRISRYMSRRMCRIEETAPQSTEELAVMRGLLHARLKSIYVEAGKRPDCPRSLNVQLKCIASIAKLFGLNLEGSTRRTPPQPVPCMTQAEIAEAVKARTSSPN